MKLSMLSKVLLLSLAFPTLVLAEDWKFVLAPYVQIPWISGDVSAGFIEDAEMDVGPDDIVDTFSMGGMLQAEAHHKSGIGFVANYAFMNLKDSVDGPRGLTEVDGETFQGVLEGFVSYRWELEDSNFDIYGGARWWDLNVEISAENDLGRREVDKGYDWVDPVVGVRYIPRINEKLRLLLQGDIGGFDVSSNSSYRVMGGLIWQMQESMALAILYSAIWVDYGKGNPGDPDRFAYDTVSHGPIFGAIFQF